MNAASASRFSRFYESDFVVALAMLLGGLIPTALFGWLTSWATWSDVVGWLVVFPIGSFVGGCLIVRSGG